MEAGFTALNERRSEAHARQTDRSEANRSEYELKSADDVPGN